jgi:hypothetical protein
MIGKYGQIAREYAEIHFTASNVVSVEYDGFSNAAIFERDADGKLFVTSYSLWFTITDDTGREANISVITESGQLFHLSTQHSDIVPGFYAGFADGIG